MNAVTDDERDDRRALAVILTNVPPELMRVLAAKDTAKTAWETIKTLRMGSERVREAKAQVRRREFEELRFKDGESIEGFALRLTGIVADLDLYGDPVTEDKAVQKFLRVVPRKYRQMAMAIESLIDLKTMTVEELAGRLSACEDHYNLDDAPQSGGRLLLTREEWLAREHQYGGGATSHGNGGPSSGGGGGKNKSPGKPKQANGGKPGGAGGSGGKKKGKFHYCNKPGHWKKECRTRIKEEEEQTKQGQAHLVRDGDEHHEGLMMARVTMSVTNRLVAPQQVHLNEEQVRP